ncbi:hypothetical protein SELMODRAFT_403326 [Selaginella moellendorffii]|uniref:Uncharacterized protein n=1 Tax=Selaginella moellendorffii TaxID=88036 RepID=D8QTT6_SELML|nr:hypothetical protein SELMODRAFT_403326 [Selaginella moellendorffii]
MDDSTSTLVVHGTIEAAPVIPRNSIVQISLFQERNKSTGLDVPMTGIGGMMSNTRLLKHRKWALVVLSHDWNMVMIQRHKSQQEPKVQTHEPNHHKRSNYNIRSVAGLRKPVSSFHRFNTLASPVDGLKRSRKNPRYAVPTFGTRGTKREYSLKPVMLLMVTKNS